MGLRWFDRVFELGESVDSAAAIIGRLRTAPDRLSRTVDGIPATFAATRNDGGWSIQEHVGHLGDLEPLWYGRVEDLLAGLEDLRPADLENNTTWAAGHNDQSMSTLLLGFRDQRLRLVSFLERLSSDELSSTALHPRLRQPMTVVDLAFFVAEHDDHHIAAIERLAGAGA